MFKYIISDFLFPVIFWTLSLLFYVVVRYAGYLDDSQSILTSSLLIQTILTGVIVGVVLHALYRANFGFKNRDSTSFVNVILLNTFGYLLFFILIIFLSSLYGNSLEFAISFLVSTESLVALLFMAINSLIYHFILQMNRMFGPGLLLEVVSGKYYKPVEEERVFMFLDLKSSTTIAEKLGHSTYSMLIQDCFRNVSNAVEKNNARIYQYVGDEVVVTWRMSPQFQLIQSVNFFFDFQRALLSRGDYFMMKYGLIPQFKAGMHCGKVMASEVGKIKTEIAYHGDVLNAASRIQGLCNEFDESFLVSESLLDLLDLNEKYRSKYLGNLELKGKNERINVHALIELSLETVD